MDYHGVMRLTHVYGVALAHHLWPPRPYVAPAKRGWREAIGVRPARAAQNESIMNPRRTQEQIGLFSTSTPPHTADVEAIYVEAMQARDTAIAEGIRGGLRRLGAALAAIGNALVSYPQRRAVYDDLSNLTDRELADIGLARGDIGRVFDPDFRLPRRPANGPAPIHSRAQAA
jgi:uncharacterized protein YjiS (DUF1127 family)